MVGNDIIDLSAAKTESNWQRKGWMRKLFSAEEILCISNNHHPEMLVWLYWSMKEAAYKIYNRKSGKNFFAPLSFICNITHTDKTSAIGQVKFEEDLYYTQSVMNEKYIHTVAKTNESDCVNIFLNQNTKAILPSHLSLNKCNKDLPYLLNNNTAKACIASKSHHGIYEAIIYCDQ